MRAILIDDEQPATELLALKLHNLNMGIDVLAKFNQPEAAIDYLRTTAFDVLFLDIEMPRLNGFDLLEALRFATFPFDVVFTTAYDQYAIQAFRFSALNYLLKPIQEDDLRYCIHQWQQRQIKHLQLSQLALLQEFKQSPSPKKRLALPTLEGHELIAVDDIIRCVASTSYTQFYLNQGPPLLICRTLKEVELALEPNGFIRVHHSHLVNPAYIQKIIRQEGGYLLMSDNSQVPISKRKRDTLVHQFTIIDRL